MSIARAPVCHPWEDRGFGLVEVLIATLVTASAVAAAAGLMAYGVRLQMLARNATNAQYVAAARLESLRVLPATAPSRQIGGSLTQDVPNYFDASAPGWRTRWVVAAGPAATRDVTLIVIPTNPLVPPIRARTLLW